MKIKEKNDLFSRTIAGNERQIRADGKYVLVVLQRALRAEDNPVIDAALDRARKLNLNIVVYSELDETAKYASERLWYFILGAYKELAIALAKKNIRCVQVIKKVGDEEILRSLTQNAAAIYTDEDHTHWDRVRTQRILDLAASAVFLVDASRLVPVRQIPSGLKTTPEFRKAHRSLRDFYFQLRQKTNKQEFPTSIEADKSIPTEHNFADYSDAELQQIVRECNIDGRLKISAEHPPTQAEIARRIATLKAQILKKYKWIRNNPALEYSTSLLSPYLHFGMLSPHQLLIEIESSQIPKSYTWKFRDEFLTWREWFHYQSFHNPKLHLYDSLPDEAKQTLEAHAKDPRPDLCSFEDILQGNTHDRTWNAAQREWLKTGWLHNNLRMYWAKQIIRFTPTPQKAWSTACYLNDLLSLDGRDPATYGSMRWAFGERPRVDARRKGTRELGDGKPGYSEKQIYGKIAPKSDLAILKREGMKQWIETRTQDWH